MNFESYTKNRVAGVYMLCVYKHSLRLVNTCENEYAFIPSIVDKKVDTKQNNVMIDNNKQLKIHK